jgi:hypothetical protein
MNKINFARKKGERCHGALFPANIFAVSAPFWGAGARACRGLGSCGFFCRLRWVTLSPAVKKKWSPRGGRSPHNLQKSAKNEEKNWLILKICGGTPGRNIKTAISHRLGPVNRLSKPVGTDEIGANMHSQSVAPFWLRNLGPTGATPLTPPNMCSYAFWGQAS